MKIIFVASLLTGSLLLNTALAQADDFKLVKNEQSIALYERWIPHNGQEVRELKAEFTLHSSAAVNFQQLLKKEALGLKWNSNASRYQVIDGERPSSWQVYMQYDMPWPMDDMDCLLSYQYQKSPKNGILAEISFRSIESRYFPVPEDFKRITGTVGKWILRKQGGDLKVTYLVKTNRNSSIPRMVSDPIIRDNLFKTMRQFKKLVGND